MIVTATQDFSFRQETMKAGETKNIHGMLAFILKSKGFVRYGITPLEAETVPEQPRKKRQYRRRDMKAEG